MPSPWVSWPEAPTPFGGLSRPGLIWKSRCNRISRRFAQLYYDTGAGLNEHNSFRNLVEGGNRQVVYRFPIPKGNYFNLRFDPTDRPRNHMTLTNARIVDSGGHLVRVIPPDQIKPWQEIENFQAGETGVSFTSSAHGNDPILALEFPEPLIIGNVLKPSFRTLARRFIVSFLITAGIFFFGFPSLVSRSVPAALRWIAAIVSWPRIHHWQVVLAAAAASVVLSCYPVVFFGKSFLSPNNHSHTFLLYEDISNPFPVPRKRKWTTRRALILEPPCGIPGLPQSSKAAPCSSISSCHFGIDTILRASLFLARDNRCSVTPFHWLVLPTRGAAGWWDLKYLIAKFLFAGCLGLSVLQLARHVPAAVIIAASAPFIGFFSYRYSHPAFFSMCYAPAILLCWFKLIDATRSRTIAAWLGVMVLANWSMINSGTVKEAYILLLAMNACGFLTLLLAGSVPDKGAKLCYAIGAQALFLLIAAPIWLTFLHTLQNSWSIYDRGAVFQLQPSLFLGLFDDIFYRQFNRDELHLDPSSNFLILAGVLWFVFSSRRTNRRKLSWGLTATCLVALAFAFGLVPPALILQWPFFRTIYHVDNTFSCVAIVCLLLLAGFGIRTFWSDCRTLAYRRIYPRVLISLAALLALFLGTTEAAQRSTRTLLIAGDHIPKSHFFWGYTAVLVVAVAAALWIGRLVIKTGRARFWHVCSLAAIFVLLHWRQGMHLATPFDAYVMNPKQRTQLIADSSAALALIHSQASEPSRTVGFNYNLFPGYGGAVGVEQIDSADPLLNKHYRALIDAYGARLPFAFGLNAGKVDDQLGADLPLFDMLNVRYYLGDFRTRSAALPSLKKIAALDLDVYESSKVWPRAFFSDRLIPYTSEQAFVPLLKNGNGLPFVAIAKEELDLHPELAGLPRDTEPPTTPLTVPATHYSLTNNTTSFKVIAPGAGVVVLTEAYVEGDLQVSVNGKPSNYFRVNSAFRGVFLPEAGEYDLSFRYWPRYLTFSLWLSAFGIVSLVLWLGFLSGKLHFASFRAPR